MRSRVATGPNARAKRRMMSDQLIIEAIKSLCFNQDARISGDFHSWFVRNLAQLLRTQNYRVERESPLFHDHLTLRTRKVRGKQGYVDLFATGCNGQTIAIEFDSGISLRYNSIEKLLQSDADILIGIVSGGTLSHNRERILEVMSKSGITDRKVLLIVMSSKTSEEVVWHN